MPNPLRTLKDEAVAARRRPDLPGWFAPAAVAGAVVLGLVVLLSAVFGPDTTTAADLREPEMPGDVATSPNPPPSPGNQYVPDFDDPLVHSVPYTGADDRIEDVLLSDYETFALFSAATGLFTGDATDLPRVGNNPPPLVPGDWQPQIAGVEVTDIVPDSDPDAPWQQFSADVFVIPTGSDNMDDATPVQITLVWDGSIDFWAVAW